MQYALLFLEGLITFISPCLLPMLPVYISFFAAGEENGRRTWVNSVGFVCGFTLVFVLLGAFAGTLGALLRAYETAVNIVTGLVVIALGLRFLGVLRIGGPGCGVRASSDVNNLTFPSAALFGMAFSVAWTPCVGAFLGSALMLASRQGGTLAGVSMLLVYSLGLGLPFIASAVLIDRLKGAFDFIKRHYGPINCVSGGLLVAVGLLMAAGMMGRFLSFLTI
jgi:cytochrome c-type biogenesis protein